jgi:predicted PurR-regulated permease PerM
MLFVNIAHLTDNLHVYEANLMLAMQELNQIAGVDLGSKVIDYFEHRDFSDIISASLDTASVLFGDAMLIPIYVLFLLLEENIFHYKLEALYPDKGKQAKTVKLFEKMDKNISRYMSLKTLVSFLTGLLSYFVLLAFGIDAPVFWAMLIFVLNYIPTIGSLIATVFPAMFAVLHFGELAPFVYILVSVGFIQVIVGNIIEPKVMGNSLNISSLVVLLSLTVWGGIWGIMGMILSVPITVMMIIVFEEIPSLRFIAILLSEKGKLNIEEDQLEKV